MCCPEPDDVQYDLSLYGWGKINIELNDFCVLFAVPSPLLSAIPPTVAHSITLLAGDTGRSYTTDVLRNGEQTADNRRTILTLPSVLSAVCIAQN